MFAAAVDLDVLFDPADIALVGGVSPGNAAVDRVLKTQFYTVAKSGELLRITEPFRLDLDPATLLSR